MGSTSSGQSSNGKFCTYTESRSTSTHSTELCLLPLRIKTEHRLVIEKSFTIVSPNLCGLFQFLYTSSNNCVCSPSYYHDISMISHLSQPDPDRSHQSCGREHGLADTGCLRPGQALLALLLPPIPILQLTSIAPGCRRGRRRG